MGTLPKKGYISCQGESGSCAFAASRVHYFDHDAAPQPSFEEVIRRVTDGDARLGLLPYRNSQAGLISEPVLLAAHPHVRFYVTAVHDHRIRHHLMVPKRWIESLPGGKERLGMLKEIDDLLAVNPDDQRVKTHMLDAARPILAQITAVYSDVQGLRQCDTGLKVHIVSAERRLTSCTAKAARIIAHEMDAAEHAKRALPAVAAIASEDCASMYENFPLVRDLNDDRRNTTRYMAISSQKPTAVGVLGDLNLKRIIGTGDAKADLTDAELAKLFEQEPLKSKLADVETSFGIDRQTAEKSGQLRIAQATVLRDQMTGAAWEDVRSQVLNRLPVELRRSVSLKLETIAKDLRDRLLKGNDKERERMAQRLLANRQSERVRSIFIIRAKKWETTSAELLKPLTEGNRRRKVLNFDIIADLPRSVVDGKRLGVGLVIEADGSLIGAEERLKKKKSAGFVSGGQEAGELERTLIGAARIADIRVLGTFAKLQPLGEPEALDRPAGSAPGGTIGPAPRRGDGGAAAAPLQAGLLAAAMALVVAGAAATWYAVQQGLF